MYNVKFVMKGSAMPDTFDQSTGVYDADADTWTVKVAFDSVYGTLPVPTKTDAKYMAGWAAAANWERSTTRASSSLPQYHRLQGRRRYHPDCRNGALDHL